VPVPLDLLLPLPCVVLRLPLVLLLADPVDFAPADVVFPPVDFELLAVADFASWSSSCCSRCSSFAVLACADWISSSAARQLEAPGLPLGELLALGLALALGVALAVGVAEDGDGAHVT
jgi:hypothetical protein